jgi:non-ribosomal peptide synthetase component F
MLIQTGRAPVPGFYTYESTFVRDDMTHRLDQIRAQISPDTTAASQQQGAGEILHSQKSIVQNGHKLAQAVGLNFQDRVLVGVPQNSIEGFTFGIVPCITEGSLFIMDQGNHFDVESNIDLVQKEYANVIVASEENVKAIVDSANAHKIAEQVKKVAVIGGESEGLKKSISSVFNGLESLKFIQ